MAQFNIAQPNGNQGISQVGISEYEWINENLSRSYPLAGNPSGLPSSFIADITLIVPAVTGVDIVSIQRNFFISAILCNGDSYYIQLSYKQQTNDDFVVATSAPIPVDLGISELNSVAHEFPFSPVIAEIPDEFSSWRNIQGTVHIGTCADLVRGVPVYFDKDTEGAYLYKNTVYVPESGITSISFVTGEGETITMSDDFTIVAGDGIDISQDENNGNIIISRISTAAEAAAMYKTVDDIVGAVTSLLGTPIKQINGIKPDTLGNFQLLGGDCTQVTSVAGGVSISNPCSTPCCSTQGNTDVTEALAFLEDAKSRLYEYFEALSTNINTMQSRLASLIASRG